MYDEIDLKHTFSIGFWSGTAVGAFGLVLAEAFATWLMMGLGRLTLDFIW